MLVIIGAGSVRAKMWGVSAGCDRLQRDHFQTEVSFLPVL